MCLAPGCLRLLSLLFLEVRAGHVSCLMIQRTSEIHRWMDHIISTIVDSELPMRTQTDTGSEVGADCMEIRGLAIMRWRINYCYSWPTKYAPFTERWPANIVRINIVLLLNVSLLEVGTGRSLPTAKTLSGTCMPIAFAVNQERRVRTTVAGEQCRRVSRLRASLKRGCDTDATIASSRRIPLKTTILAGRPFTDFVSCLGWRER